MGLFKSRLKADHKKKKNSLKGKSNRFFFVPNIPFYGQTIRKPRMIFFLAFWRCKIFSNCNPLHDFFKICFLPYSWRICSGPLCDDLPSLGGTVQRRHSKALTLMPAARPLRDSLQLNQGRSQGRVPGVLEPPFWVMKMNIISRGKKYRNPSFEIPRDEIFVFEKRKKINLKRHHMPSFYRRLQYYTGA